MDTTTSKKENNALVNCFEWVSLMIVSLLIVAVIFTFFFRVVGVSGDSMCNTLEDGDRLVLVTQFYTVERGDVVVIYRSGEDPYIKRVIGVAGDTVDIDDARGCVLINGEPLKEDYVVGVTTSEGFKGPYTVKEGEVFVLGDNRQLSLDSRRLGAFSVDEIAGEAAFRLFPFNKIGKI
jgi:signal peptidase I